MEATPFNEGYAANEAGIARDENPYPILGVTKLGNPKRCEDGTEWDSGWLAAKPARTCSAKELVGAAQYDASRFRRKANRYYQSN